MNIEKRIEDLCLERLKLREKDSNSLKGKFFSIGQRPACESIGSMLSMARRAKVDAQHEIRQARIEAIDIQLELLRKDYAREYIEGLRKDYASLINDRLMKASEGCGADPATRTKQ